MRTRSLSSLMLLVLLLVSVAPLAAQETEAADVFPVTIEHQFGSTTIPAAPQRVVAIGYTEQDFLLALGVTPVAVRYWYGDEDDAIFPWADDLVEGDAPIVLNMPFGTLNYEAILDLEPDLISAVTAGITQEEYELLSQIAPTITQTADYINFGMPWQEVTHMIGVALGKSAEAETIVNDVEALFADARAEHPQFEGKTVAVSYYYSGTYGFYTSQDSRGRFFTDLGFVIPDELVEIAGESFYADISAERIDLIDQDLIAILNLQFIEGGREGLESQPLFSQLEAVQAGRVVYLEAQAENALGFSSPLSLAYALDAVLPQLEAIFGADATDVVSCEQGYRLFEHEYLGSDAVCVPENPERIAVLDLSLLEVVLIQGIEPVAMYEYGRDLIARSNPEINVDVIGLTAATADVGNSGAPNLEVLLETAPDLIIASEYTATTAGLDVLQEIAPTVVFSYPLSQSEYRSSVEFVTAVLGTPETGDEILAGLDARLADFQDLMGGDLSTTNISLVRLRDSLILFVGGSFGDHLIHEAGLSRPEQQQPFDVNYVENENNGWVGFEVSEENLPLLDGEYIFVWTASPSVDVEAEAQALLPTLLEDPLWATLEGVQNNHLFIVGSHWQGFGILEAHTALDDLFRYIAEVEPQEVSPNPFLIEN